MSDIYSLNVLKVDAKEASANALIEAIQIEAQGTFLVEVGEDLFNPWAADEYKKKMLSLQDRSERRKKDSDSNILEIDTVTAEPSVDEAALRYQQKNPELAARSLKKLLQSLKDSDSPDEILKKVLDYFPDKSLADEALSFLIENTQGSLQTTIKYTKKTFNNDFSREIIAGKNIASTAQEFSKLGFGTPSNLKDLYRDITGNPRSSNILFGELSRLYNFQQLKDVIKFLLNSLGRDLTSKGPSIQRGELSRLFTEARSLQSILGVYRFFQSRMGLVNKQLSDLAITLPANLTFENLAQNYMKLVEDRYPAGTKIIALAENIGISKEKAALIILISQFRDAVRSVSPRLYKTIDTRDELFKAIIEALTGLEEEEVDE